MKKRRKSVNGSKLQISSSRPVSKNALVNDTDADATPTENEESRIENYPIENETIKDIGNLILDYEISPEKGRMRESHIKDECGSEEYSENSDEDKFKL